MATGSSAPALAVEGLSKSYGSVQALQDVSFEQEPNTILGLVGDNGAGKSTLLQIVNGFEQPDEGRIRLDGEPVSFSSPRDAREAGVAMTYESFALVDGAPVWENFFMGRERTNDVGPVRTVRKSEMMEEVAETLDDYGFSFDIHKRSRELSGGQRRILVVSRAIESEPRLLLLDEPFRGLSERAIAQLWEILHDYKRTGSVIVTSQWYSTIEAEIDDVMIFRQGEKVGKFDNDAIDRTECNRLMMEGRSGESAPDAADSGAGRGSESTDADSEVA
jgi:ABC-type sugar transport system ATPase subunit